MPSPGTGPVLLPSPKRGGAGGGVLQALADGDVEAIARCLHNRLEGPAMRLSPSVAEWLRRLRNTGAAGCLMSGSGSSLFALCRDGGEALRVADAIRADDPAKNEFARTRVFLVRSCA